MERTHPTRKRDADNDGAEPAENALKRKRDEENKANNPKLQEYLSLVQHPSKTRTWANDDDMVQSSEDHMPTIYQATQETSVSEELPSQPKKARIEESTAHIPSAQPEPMVVDKSKEEESNENGPQEDNLAAPEAEAEPVSDADWLRSKTSRLLGLLDEEEQAEFESQKVNEPIEAPADTSDESRNAAIENTKSQAAANADCTAQPPSENDTTIDLIRTSARLFVRNLAYDLTETDLRPLFAPFGKLEEVSFFLSHSIVPLLSR